MFTDITVPAVVSHLQTALGLDVRSVFAHVDGTIPPVYGSTRVVHVWSSDAAAGTRAGDFQLGHDVYAGLKVGFTYRCGPIPEDRLFAYLYAENDSMYKFVRRVWTILERDKWDIQEAINTALPVEWKMVEPLVFTSQEIVFQRVGPEHFHADPEKANNRTDFGVHCVLDYSSGRFASSWSEDGNADPLSTPGSRWSTGIA